MISKKMKNPMVEVEGLYIKFWLSFFINSQIMRYGCLNKMEILTPRVSAASFALLKLLQRTK